MDYAFEFVANEYLKTFAEMVKDKRREEVDAKQVWENANITSFDVSQLCKFVDHLRSKKIHKYERVNHE